MDCRERQTPPDCVSRSRIYTLLQPCCGLVSSPASRQPRPVQALLVLIDLELGKDVVDLAQVLLLGVDGGRVALVGEIANRLQDRGEPLVVGQPPVRAKGRVEELAQLGADRDGMDVSARAFLSA